MNLSKLFEIQRKLDDHIEKEHPREEGEDRLAKKILALQVELGELANEWRGFKFWSSDQEPRTTAKCETCDGLGNDIYFTGSYDNGNLQECSEPCEYCDGTGDDDSKNPLLEEYVDCLHFFISIAIDLEIKPNEFVVSEDYTEPTTTETFNSIFSTVSSLHVLMKPDIPGSITKDDLKETLHEAFSGFVGLGETQLGFTWEQVEQAYLEKNKINHERQNNGY